MRRASSRSRSRSEKRRRASARPRSTSASRASRARASSAAASRAALASRATASLRAYEALAPCRSARSAWMSFSRSERSKRSSRSLNSTPRSSSAARFSAAATRAPPVRAASAARRRTSSSSRCAWSARRAACSASAMARARSASFSKAPGAGGASWNSSSALRNSASCVCAASRSERTDRARSSQRCALASASRDFASASAATRRASASAARAASSCASSSCRASSEAHLSAARRAASSAAPPRCVGLVSQNPARTEIGARRGGARRTARGLEPRASALSRARHAADAAGAAPASEDEAVIPTAEARRRVRFALFLDLADAGFRKPKSARTRAKPGHESEGVRGASRERRKRGVPRRFPVRRDPRAVSSGATRLGELQSETAGFSKYPKRGNHFQLLVCELNNLLGRFPCTFSSCFRMRVSTCRNCIRVSRRLVAAGMVPGKLSSCTVFTSCRSFRSSARVLRM